MCIRLNILLECHEFNSRFRKRFTNFLFTGSGETCKRAQTFNATDFDGCKVHYSCQTLFIIIIIIITIFIN